MISISEIRMGNWFFFNGEVEQVSYIMSEHLLPVNNECYLVTNNCYLSEIVGIPITNDVLSKCGFKNVSDIQWQSPEDWFHCCPLNDTWVFRRAGFTLTEVRYLHQLQNIWFAIFKYELNYHHE